jgi:hypothetical protein
MHTKLHLSNRHKWMEVVLAVTLLIVVSFAINEVSDSGAVNGDNPSVPELGPEDVTGTSQSAGTTGNTSSTTGNTTLGDINMSEGGEGAE